MKFKKVVIGIVLALILVSLPFILAGVTHAQAQGIDQSAIQSKLDQILDNQKLIIDQVATIKAELNIVKIRVTQAQ